MLAMNNSVEHENSLMKKVNEEMKELFKQDKENSMINLGNT